MLNRSLFIKKLSRWKTIIIVSVGSIMFAIGYAFLMGSSTDTTMRLNNNRFEVSVNWRNYNDGSTGQGTAVKLTSDSGYFWFFNSSNIELVIKVLDGRSVNGFFWVIYGALSDVEYTLLVQDMFTGVTKRYFNPAHHLASVSDVNAFIGPATPSTTLTPTTTGLSTTTTLPGGWSAGQLYAVDSIVGNLRYVPAGTFTQGSPPTEPCRLSNETQFRHTLTLNLAVMETEVSRQMWADLKVVQPSLRPDPTYEPWSPEMTTPVLEVPWEYTVLFANLLSIQQGLTPAYYLDADFLEPLLMGTITARYCKWDATGYRLPSEGEWEYFTRAGTTGPFFITESNYLADNCDSYSLPGMYPTLETVAWFGGNSSMIKHSSPVGSKLANAWNLKDVHGNVAEWCWDRYGTYPAGSVTDYRGVDEKVGSFRVFRDGPWNSGALNCRSAGRAYYPVRGHFSYGFRLCRSIPSNSVSTTTSSSSTTTTLVPPYAIDPIVGNLRYVPAGTFTQGSPATEVGRYPEEGPQFQHTLTKNMAVMETEVTQQMWDDLKAVQGSLPGNPSVFTYNRNIPVEYVTWYQAVLFANLLSVQQGLTRAYYEDASFATPITSANYTTEPFFCNWNANGYRLPTEGEWEYFARAGTTGPFSINEPAYNSSTLGSCIAGSLATLESVAWFCANSDYRTHSVGRKRANPWGLKDVYGNVGEWCWDQYGTYPTSGQTDFRGALSDSSRVIRGGGSYSFPRHVRSSLRSSSHPGDHFDTIGFRLVRTVN